MSLVVYSCSNILPKNVATSSASGLNFMCLPGSVQDEHVSQFDPPSHSCPKAPQCVPRSQTPYRRSKTWRCWAEVRKEAQTRALCVPETSTWRHLCISLLPTLKPNQISLVMSSLIWAVGWNTVQCIHALPGEIERQQFPWTLTISTSPLAPSLLSFFRQQFLLFCFLRVLYPTKRTGKRVILSMIFVFFFS